MLITVGLLPSDSTQRRVGQDCPDGHLTLPVGGGGGGGVLFPSLPPHAVVGVSWCPCDQVQSYSPF